MKTHIYFIPGLAASSKIFENIELDTQLFECHYLEWIEPLKNESLLDYIKRFAPAIDTYNHKVFVGVSFGGIVAQELAFLYPNSKVVLVSSIKTKKELPWWFQWAYTTKLYKLFPSFSVKYIVKWGVYCKSNNFICKRLKIYNTYFKMHTSNYINWAIFQLLSWKRETIYPKTAHIHGIDDKVFPVRFLENYTGIKNENHVLILTRYKWINENFEQLLKQLDHE